MNYQNRTFDKEKFPSRIIAEQNPGMCFAALKLIEQLYRDRQIPAYMFRAIVNDYSDIVDVSQFMTYGKENENV